MTAQVDVLAVMDEASRTQALREDRQDMREARAAVAELIEAIKEERKLRDLGSEVDVKTLADAMRRTSAAIARFDGGAQ